MGRVGHAVEEKALAVLSNPSHWQRRCSPFLPFAFLKVLKRKVKNILDEKHYGTIQSYVLPQASTRDSGNFLLRPWLKVSVSRSARIRHALKSPTAQASFLFFSRFQLKLFSKDSTVTNCRRIASISSRPFLKEFHPSKKTRHT